MSEFTPEQKVAEIVLNHYLMPLVGTEVSYTNIRVAMDEAITLLKEVGILSSPREFRMDYDFNSLEKEMFDYFDDVFPVYKDKVNE